ncbi:MAG: prephenate dehydratase [Cyanobacteria bacterium J06628_6]
MMIAIAYLGPPGTYSELAAETYARWRNLSEYRLCPFPSITKAIQATANQSADICVAPVENSIGGSVAATLDTLWQTDTLQIQHALVLPIHHALVSRADSLDQIKTVYSHPQALAQCQNWLEQSLPDAQLTAINSTTEGLQYLPDQPTAATISSLRAAQLHNLPVLAHPINDWPDNCTRFWMLSPRASERGSHTSIAFGLPTNTPGALLKPLQLFATQNINMSRIESRPTKRLLGDYLFFIDIEASLDSPQTQAALQLLRSCTETLKCFGSYDLIQAEALNRE